MTRPVILVADYLRRGGTFETLLVDHGVRAKPYAGKVSFIYDQLAAKDEDALACQCRGLVLRDGSWDVVAYPFDRFFNLGQGAAAPIDWDTAAFEEKLDGTLLIVYWDKVPGRWLCATRSMAEAHGNVNGVGTFAELADEASRRMGVGAASLHHLMEGVGADRGVTYLFELTSPYNRIVCAYPELTITLLGMRRLSDYQELDPVTEGHDLGTGKRWRFSSIAELAEVMTTWSPVEYEGVIVKDAAFRRVKVKSPQYLAAHHATDSLGSSWRAVCEAILTGHADDIAAAVIAPVRDRIESLRPAVAKLIETVESDYAELRGIDDMKTFALAAQKRAWSAPLFALKRGKTESATKFVAEAQADTVLELCRKLGWKEPEVLSPMFEEKL